MAKSSSPILAADATAMEPAVVSVAVGGSVNPPVSSKSQRISRWGSININNNISNHNQRGYRTEALPWSSQHPRRSSASSQEPQHHYHGHHPGGGTASVASATSRDSSRRSFYSHQSRGSQRNRSRSRSKEYYGDSSNRHPPPSWKEHEQSYQPNPHYNNRRRQGSPPRGDRYPYENGRCNQRHGEDELHRYGPDVFDGESYVSGRSGKRRGGDSSICSSPRDRRRDRSMSRDGEYSSSWPHNRDSAESPESVPMPAEEWPPCFDKDGSLFVFDTRSAMFYESLSDFFYDPKSKLYYGNRKGAYFRYDSTKNPPFVEVQKVTDSTTTASQDGTHNTMDQVPVQSTMAAGHGTEAPKPKIAIKLKTKKIKSLSDKRAAVAGSEASAQAAMPKAHKDKIANIEKWTEKQAELKQNPNTLGDANNPVSKYVGAVRMTSKGEPICVVCRRKFPNIEKLRLHERASDLHKQNLQKLKEKELAGTKRNSPEAMSTDIAPEYQDRAAKRRQLHGPPLSDALIHRPLATPHHEPPAKGEALDETHVGHKMLQKLGWKGHGNEDAGNGESKSTSASDQLRKEWDRIESLAGSASRPASGTYNNNT